MFFGLSACRARLVERWFRQFLRSYTGAAPGRELRLGDGGDLPLCEEEILELLAFVLSDEDTVLLPLKLPSQSRLRSPSNAILNDVSCNHYLNEIQWIFVCPLVVFQH